VVRRIAKSLLVERNRRLRASAERSGRRRK
jgi:hypothetical protein